MSSAVDHSHGRSPEQSRAAQGAQGEHRDRWLFPSQPSSRPEQQHPQNNSAQMIGPTPTFYDPEQVQDQQTADYGHWASPAAYPHNSYSISNPYPQQQQPAQNQYQFVHSHHSASLDPSGYYDGNQRFVQPQQSPMSAQPADVYGGIQGYSQPQNRSQQAQQTHQVYQFSHYALPDTTYPGPLTSAYTPLSEVPSLPSHPSISPQWQDHTLPLSASTATASSPAPAPAAPATSAPPKRERAATKPQAKTKGRKRPKKSQDESNSDSDDDDDDNAPLGPSTSNAAQRARGQAITRFAPISTVQMPPPSTHGLGPQRLPGACTYCKKLKMKCDFPEDANKCKRCQQGGHQCIVEGRKPRSAPNKREYLLSQIRQKDVIIESLLKQLHNPYLATPLSITAYRMATPDADTHRQSVITWLDRMQASTVRNTNNSGINNPFSLDSRMKLPTSNTQTGRDSDSDNGDNVAQSSGHRRGPSGHESGEETSPQTLVDPEAESYPGLPDAAVPLGLLATLSISNSKSKLAANRSDNGGSGTEGGAAAGAGGRGTGTGAAGSAAGAVDEEDDDVGVANETYFLPGPSQDLSLRATLIEKTSPPDILVHGLVTPEEVDELFRIFYARVNPFISLLDPVLHTPDMTFSRCPFLFTVICAISLRYSEKTEVYPIAMHFAKSAAANALIDGWKSVELCQAYILMSIYAVPARRWEEDRSWLYTGLAIRIATDLNLHQPAVAVGGKKTANEMQEREVLNKARVWQICFNLDRSTATQFGKPSTIKEDYIIRHSTEWYKKSKYNHPYDVHLNGYSSLLRIVAGFHDEVFSDPEAPTGLNQSIDFRAVTLRHDELLMNYHEEWQKRFDEDSDHRDAGCEFRCKLLPFLVNYSRLVMYSFGFQQAFLRGMGAGDEIFFTKCLESAKGVVTSMIESLAPSGYMRYAPDGHFVFSSFASAFLLKLLRPEFKGYLSQEQQNEIFELIGRLINTLGSPQIAIDERHTPRLYSRFLAGLLSKHRSDGATTGRLHTQPPPGYRSPPNPGSGTMSGQPDAQAQYQQQQQHRPGAGSSNSSGTGSGAGGAGAGGGSLRGAATARPTQPESLLTHIDTSFTFTPPPQTIGRQQQESSSQRQQQRQPSLSEPIYQPEATYGVGSGPLDMDGMGGFDSMGLGLGLGLNEDALATMQAIKNPAWWNNMMMPGFSWPCSGDMPFGGNAGGGGGGGNGGAMQQGSSSNFGDVGGVGGSYYARGSNVNGYSTVQAAQAAPVHLG